MQSKKQGPIHIEFPDDMQRHEVEITDDEISILISTSKNTPGEVCDDNLEGQINNISKLIQASNKPIVLLGAGCRKLNIEQITALKCFIGNSIVVSTWGGISIAKKFPNYAGCIGTYSSLKCNKFLSECDLLMSIGSRLQIIS